jgi:hypothetical protein
MKLRCPWDRNNPRLLSKQPSKGYLSRCCLLSFCDLAQQINQRLIRFSSFLLKARDDVAEMGTIELRIFVDLAREEALTKRSRVGRRVDESMPMVDARLPDGSRVHAIIPPVAIDGPYLSIRRFGTDPVTARDMMSSVDETLRPNS